MNWGSFLSRFTLQTKITVLVVVGLLSTIGVFTNLGLTALEKSTRTRLQERLVIARLVADYQDQVLMLALKRLEAAAGRVEPSAQPPLSGLEL